MDVFFNPILDVDGNWVISEQEINQCVNNEFYWLKNLKLSEFNPPINKLII